MDAEFIEVRARLRSQHIACSTCGDGFWLFAITPLLSNVDIDWPSAIDWRCSGCKQLGNLADLLEGARRA